MVSDEDFRNLRVLADKYHIKQKRQSEPWPPAHESTFRNIQQLSERKFEAYGSCSGNQSDLEPWIERTKSRTKWLVDQASDLSSNSCNEIEWRTRIEDAILERFSVEVACPICKDRLWRSEIESSPSGSGRIWTELGERKDKRKSCTCSPADRPQDRYEFGRSKIFQDRADAIVVHASPIAGLPQQKPDRIVGLRETNNFRTLLDQRVTSQSGGISGKVRDVVRYSPFKRLLHAPLFPFLIVEAKSDSAQYSFSDIQTQTAFPIWELLNLQKDLYGFTPRDQRSPAPLVWFLGYRGSDWKVYGCYLDMDRESNITYNIHHLRGGDITTRDDALQLFLIIDYIMDWARDTFRPTVLAQLSSLITGKSFDEISLGPDTDIVSKETILGWVSEVPDNVALDQDTGQSGNMPVHQEGNNVNSLDILPNTKLGAVRPLYTSTFQLAGLRITEGNVKSLLALNDGVTTYSGFSKTARKILSHITRWDEILVVLGADLDSIEQVWTNEEISTSEPFDEGPGSEFYAIFEYRCFMSDSWELIRELSYIAISKSAFNILVQRARFKRANPYVDDFWKTLRPCPSSVIREATECLHSGAMLQVFHSAVSSRLLILCPEPQRQRADVTPPVSYLGLAYPLVVRVRSFIEEFLKEAERSQPKARRFREHEINAHNIYKKHVRAWKIYSRNRSYRRMTQRVIQNSNMAHDATTCSRCRSSKQDRFALKYWDQENAPSPTAYGAALVASLEAEAESGPAPDGQRHHDLSLFILNELAWLENEVPFQTVVEDLAQNDSIYHAILHHPRVQSCGENSDVWNLPLPYRRSTMKQRRDIARWVRELNGDPNSDNTTTSIRPWVHQQILLSLLRRGMSHEDALAALIRFSDSHMPSFGFDLRWGMSPSTELKKLRASRIETHDFIQHFNTAESVLNNPKYQNNAQHDLTRFDSREKLSGMQRWQGFRE